MRADYEVIHRSANTVVIRDTWHPGSDRLTVTNDAERVISQLDRHYTLTGSMRVFYYDTEGILSELDHDGFGNFMGFRLLSRDERESLVALMKEARNAQG